MQPKASHHAEPEPITGIVALNSEDDKVSATHPEIGFKAIGSEQTAVRKILWRNNNRNRAEKQCKTSASEFARQHGGLNHQKGRGERGNEANGAEGISQHCSADVDEKRNERRLVDIAPGQMIAARDVIELVAKVAVAIVEIDVEEQFGQGNRYCDAHARGEE